MIRFLNTLTLWILLVAVGGSALQAAAPVQDRDAIRQAAHDYVLSKAKSEHRSRAEITVGRLDPRLRLTACGEDLAAFQPPGGRSLGNTTVGIRCPAPKPWTIYVPVKVIVYRAVVVSARPLPRGQLLGAGDVKLEQANLAELRAGYLTDPSQAIGNKLKRPLSDGTPLSAAMIQAPHLVKRGQQVTVINEVSGVQVRITGKALMDGASGERIRVRNPSSRRVVEAMVVSPGVVRIIM